MDTNPFPPITADDLQSWLDGTTLCFATDKRPDGADVKLVFTLFDRAWKLRVDGEAEESIGRTEKAAALFNQASGRFADNASGPEGEDRESEAIVAHAAAFARDGVDESVCRDIVLNNSRDRRGVLEIINDDDFDWQTYGLEDG